MDCSPPGCSVRGILQVSILEWVAMPSSRGSSQSREWNPGLLHCRWALYHLSHQGRPDRAASWQERLETGEHVKRHHEIVVSQIPTKWAVNLSAKWPDFLNKWSFKNWNIVDLQWWLFSWTKLLQIKWDTNATHDIVQHREYSQYSIITRTLKIENHFIVRL